MGVSHGAARQVVFTRQIRASADALLALINDVLDLAKIEAGHFELVDLHFSATEVLHDAIDAIAPRAAERGVEVACYPAPAAAAAVVGDPDRLRQVPTISFAATGRDSGSR